MSVDQVEEQKRAKAEWGEGNRDDILEAVDNLFEQHRGYEFCWEWENGSRLQLLIPGGGVIIERRGDETFVTEWTEDDLLHRSELYEFKSGGEITVKVSVSPSNKALQTLRDFGLEKRSKETANLAGPLESSEYLAGLSWTLEHDTHT